MTVADLQAIGVAVVVGVLLMLIVIPVTLGLYKYTEFLLWLWWKDGE